MINPKKISNMLKDIPNLATTIQNANDKINKIVQDIENLKERVGELENEKK